MLRSRAQRVGLIAYGGRSVSAHEPFARHAASRSVGAKDNALTTISATMDRDIVVTHRDNHRSNRFRECGVMRGSK